VPFVSPKKSLGQNFLRDENVARKIIGTLQPIANDVFLEIGAGHGMLTKYLAHNVRHLCAYEIDTRMIEDLQTLYASEQAEIRNEDFLTAKFDAFAKQFSTPVRVVGNIPYNITSQILFKLFEDANNGTVISDATLMMQVDVAQRIVAPPHSKTYGILSVFSQYFCDCTLLFTVSPNCFYPKPTVTSAIVQFRFREPSIEVSDEKIFRAVVRTVFGKRRKILRNGLSYLPYDEKMMHHFFQSTSFPLTVRPEDLSIKEFIELSNELTVFIQTYSPTENIVSAN